MIFKFIFPSVFCFFLVIFSQHLTLSEQRCRCLSNDPNCWPNASVWQNFNQSIDGRLISPKPSAEACNSNVSYLNACSIAIEQWTNPFWRGNQAGAMQNENWENSSCSIYFNSTNCNQGSVPILAVNATLPEHVQATIQLVNTYNLRLVIKTSGHDYLGRSTAFGSLLLWLHYMKNKTLIENFNTCTGENISNAIRLDAGVQWGEVYSWLSSYNLVAIGGASSTVGAVGGYLQGGGHGPLTRWKGLAVDQVLEFDVIMADGSRQTVNQCQNSDLFWALRGGGAGTFAVVLSAVLRTYETPSFLGSFLTISAPNASRYNNFIHHFTELLPTMANDGWAGYFYVTGLNFLTVFLLPNGDPETANATINELTNDFSDFNISGIPLTVFSYDSSSTADSTGENVLLGSRLIPQSIIDNQPDQVADVLLQLNDHNQSIVIGHLVAGGQVSNSTQNNSVNPAWRTALVHLVYAQSWLDGTSNDEQQRLAEHVNEQVEIMQTIAGGSQSGAYMNEANPNEPEWQQKFFGTIENYNRLKSIKNTVDPNGIFICKTCVGSDDWSEDLNCPKLSRARENYLTIKLFLLSIVFTLV